MASPAHDQARPAPEGVRALASRRAIVDTIVRYATGLDRRDWELYRSCFADEVVVDFSSWSGAPAGPIPADAWVAGVRAGLSGFHATQHLTANYSVRLDGDRAASVSYVQAQHRLEGHPGGDLYTLGGYYSNRLMRVDGDWRIERCRLTVTWTRGDRDIFVAAARRFAELEGANA